MEFARHVTDASETSGVLWSSAGFELELGEVALAIAKFGEIVEFSSAELEWLETHSPLDCYRPLRDQWREAMQMSQDLATLLKDGFSSWDTEKLDRGMAMMAELNRELPAVVGQVDQMVRECGG